MPVNLRILDTLIRDAHNLSHQSNNHRYSIHYWQSCSGKIESFTSRALSKKPLELHYPGRSSETSKSERHSNTPKDNLLIHPKNHLEMMKQLSLEQGS